MADAAKANGAGKTIVFSHANSFPAGTYRLLFDTWRAAGYTVHAVGKYGHDPAYPVTNHWPRLRDQLIHFAQAHVTEPAYFVGHSLGGFLSVLAAAKQPALARGVVLLDSPLIGGLLSTGIQAAKVAGAGGRFPPAVISRGRRNHWPSPDAARAHFASKPVFASWHPPVLEDYIAHGIEPAAAVGNSGVTLSFHREVETQIYQTVPHNITRFLRRHPLKCPVAFIGGTRSAEVRQIGMATTQRVTAGRVSWLDGTHLFPFERPDDAAAETLRWLGVLDSIGTPA